eukprot:166780-Amphidinium_carterae.3
MSQCILWHEQYEYLEYVRSNGEEGNECIEALLERTDSSFDSVDVPSPSSVLDKTLLCKRVGNG